MDLNIGFRFRSSIQFREFVWTLVVLDSHSLVLVPYRGHCGAEGAVVFADISEPGQLHPESGNIGRVSRWNKLQGRVFESLIPTLKIDCLDKHGQI